MSKNICPHSEQNTSEILPNLFIGNLESSKDSKFIAQNHIGTIIRIMENDDDSREFSLTSKKINNINYYIIPIHDVDACLINLNPLFDKTSEIIKDSLKHNIPVLVHCKNGHHRSAAIIAAFIIKYFNIDFSSAVNYIRIYRKCALRKDKCMLRAVFQYYKYLNGEICDKIIAFRDERNDTYNYRCG